LPPPAEKTKYDHGHDHGHIGPEAAVTKIMKASEFKAKCLAVMDEVARTGETVVITKNGKPVAEVVPHKTKDKPQLFGMFKDVLEIKGDIISPIDVEWDAMK
jgi:prevent-host-death family protein